jgi:hypothetical protein
MFFVRYRGGKGVMARATSQDGLNWSQGELLPSLVPDDLFPHREGDLANFPFHGETCIQHDPNASDGYRFYTGVKCTDDTLCMLVSEDGFTWENRGRKFGRATDTYPCIYKVGGEYRGLIRHDFGRDEGNLWRAVRGVQQLRGGPNGSLEGSREWYLDRYGSEEWRRRSLYALTRTEHEGMFLGLASVYEFPYGVASARPFTTDIVRPYLVTSRDGERWNLDWIRSKSLVPSGGEADFDHGMVLPAADWVTHGGYHWLYYAGWNSQHESHSGANANIGLVRWRRDRLLEVTLAEDADSGQLLTKPFEVPSRARALSVNAACEDGMVSVHMLNAQSNSVIASGSLAGIDDMDALVALTDSSGLQISWSSLMGRSARLRFTLSGQASLYAFRFVL